MSHAPSFPPPPSPHRPYKDLMICRQRYPDIYVSKMAGNYSSQTHDQPNNQPPLFGTQQMSPAESAMNSPNNASPTSPRFQNQLQHHVPGQVRQLRPMKSPLYVPAALRPTERPNKNTPPTPPKSLQGSLDSLQDEGHASVDSLRAPVDLVVGNDWIANEDLGEVTGEPTREHWKVSTISSLPALCSQRPAQGAARV